MSRRVAFLFLGETLLIPHIFPIVEALAAADPESEFTKAFRNQVILSSRNAGRIILEQAKGVIAHSGNIEIDDAFTVLRRYAREHGRKLGAVAADVVNRELRAETLLQHGRSATNAR